MESAFLHPYTKVTLNIGKEEDETYESKEPMLDQLTSLNRAIRQWRQPMTPELFNRHFLPAVAARASTLVVEGLLRKEHDQEIS